MSRERLAKASTSSDLGWDENRIKDVDAVTALGVIQLRDSRMLRLGRNLILLRGYEEARSKTDLQDRMREDREETIELIAAIVEHHPDFKGLSERQRMILCRVGMLEWVFDRCRQCHGAKAIVRSEGGTITCQACNGTGKHRYSDLERADNLGTQVHRMIHYERALNAVLGACGTAEPLAYGAANEYLEKYGSK